MLADDGIVFLDLHLSGGVLLVFIGRVEVTGTGRRYQADFISCALGHCSNPPLYLFAACPQVSQYNINAFLVDDAQSLGGDAKFYPAILAFHPETVAVEIGQKTPLALDIRVRHIVSGYRPFSGDLANS
jgi:hypothetical protein